MGYLLTNGSLYTLKLPPIHGQIPKTSSFRDNAASLILGIRRTTAPGILGIRDDLTPPNRVSVIDRGYYTVARRYEFYFRVDGRQSVHALEFPPIRGKAKSLV